MRIFRKKTAGANLKQEELAATIAGRIISWQTKVAEYLNGKTAHLSRETKLLLLILFCALFAVVNLYLLIQSI